MPDVVVAVSPGNSVIYDNTADRIVIEGTPDMTSTLNIKGFVSVDIVDRQGEKVDPSAFDIDGFMRAGSVLVNHHLWFDDRGCPGSVGTVTSLHEVELRELDAENWEVYDVRKNVRVDTYPKSRNGNFYKGLKGLYTFIRLSNPDVISMVNKGELKSFSWRGDSIRDYRYDRATNSTYPSYSKIGIWEISLVSVPVQPDSGFVVSKDMFHSMWLDKSRYNLNQARALADKFRLPCDKIYETDDGICIYSGNATLATKSLSTFEAFSGACIVTASTCNLATTSQAKFDISKDALTRFHSSLMRTTQMSEQAPATGNATPVAPVAKFTPEELSVVTKGVVDALIPAFSETITKLTDSLTSTLTTGMTGLTEVVKGMQPKTPEPAAKAPEVAAEGAQKLVDSVKSLIEEHQRAVDAKLADIQKSFTTIIPQSKPRGDSTEPGKTPADGNTGNNGGTPDKNSVFNSIFLQMARR
jgi:hypothetical protein